mmetsp:Transcript_135193/g.328593  ORF Transcript_135193/g.328593 Transcript_135193/m.328593 type:complete len:669 (+) Transcript_135193:3-2009(+)
MFGFISSYWTGTSRLEGMTRPDGAGQAEAALTAVASCKTGNHGAAPMSEGLGAAQPAPARKAAGRSIGRLGFVTGEMRASLFGGSAATASAVEDGADDSAAGLTSADSAGLGSAEPSKKRRRGRRQVAETEVCRAEAGLRLIREQAPTSARWDYPLCDERRRCFVGHLTGAFSPDVHARLLNAAQSSTEWMQPEGRFGKMPRKTAWMVKSPCTCKYGYGGVLVKPASFPSWLHEAMEICMPLCGLSDPQTWPDSCNLNLYEDGAHSVAWHADDEGLFQGTVDDCLIISLSLGHARRFQLKPAEDSEGDGITSLLLSGGDLCTMEGMTQKHYFHRVPKERGDSVGPRVNLTWRFIKAHGSGCELAAVRSKGRAREDEQPQPASKRQVCAHPRGDDPGGETADGPIGVAKADDHPQLARSVQVPAESRGDPGGTPGAASGEGKSRSALKKVSKQLVRVLGQRSADSADGFCVVEEVLAVQCLRQLGASLHDLEQLAKSEDAGRFQLERREGVLLIRDARGRGTRMACDQESASRRLTLDDDLPAECIHGAPRDRWPRVLQRGFLASGARGVLFSTAGCASGAESDPATGLLGDRTVAVYLDLRQALSDSMRLFLTSRGTVLAEGFDGVVPPKYFLKAVDLELGHTVWERPGRDEVEAMSSAARASCETGP